MLILPIGDVNPCHRVPYVNWLFLALNVVVFLALGFRADYPEIVRTYAFLPAEPTWQGALFGMFMHAGLGHLLGNMLFLWIVGDNVEDSLGHLGYAVFYLGAGFFADYAHMAMVPPEMAAIPTLGASGAVAGVLGAYALLYPRSRIKFWFFIWVWFYIRTGFFHLASAWAVGFWFLQQIFLHFASGGAGGVAYGAHIGGLILGAVGAGLLVLLGVVEPHWGKPPREFR